MPQAVLRSRVVALTLALLVSTAAAAEATSITFDQIYYFHDGTLLDSDAGANNAIRIQIASVIEPFDLVVSAIEVSQDQFAQEIGGFSGLNCLSYLSDHNCLEYNVTPTQPGLYTGPIFITIGWLLDTNPITTSPTLLQAEGDDPFSFQLRDQQYFPHSTGGIPFCTNNDNDECDDPADTGTTDNFSRFVVAYPPPEAVPEPGTFVMVGCGAIGMMYRRRNQRRPR
jgi:hypothetical protein